MTIDESITQWIDELRRGDDAAAQQLWGAFFDRLLHLAQARMRKANRAAYDEEDIVVSAFKSFCVGLRKGRYPQLKDREDLWRLLFVITSRKIADQFVFQARGKRDSRRIADLHPDETLSSSEFQELVHSREPSPEFAAECAEQLHLLLDQLQQEELKQIAILKMEGYRNEEIAKQKGRSLATIERKLKTIRQIWSQTGR